jgi:hypothetical protein
MMHCKKFFTTLGCSLLLGFPAWAVSNGPWRDTTHVENVHFVTHDSDGFRTNVPSPTVNSQNAPTGPNVHWVPPTGTHHIDTARWHEGHWWHGAHGGRFGWWWIVGPDFYEYPDAAVVYPAPPPLVQGYWYWCDAYRQYYPYVAVCPSGWRAVLPGAPIG